MVEIDGVKGVDERVAYQGADLSRDVCRVPVNDMRGAVRAKRTFIFAQTGRGNDRPESGQLADLHGVFATIASGADDQDGFLAVVNRGFRVVRKWEWKKQAVLAEDGPEGRDQIADQGSSVVVCKTFWDLGDREGIKYGVFLETRLIGRLFELVCLAENVIPGFERCFRAWTDRGDDSRNIIANHKRELTFDEKAPISNAVLIRIH